MIAGDGPCNRERLAQRVKAWDEGAWVRDAALALRPQTSHQAGGRMSQSNQSAANQSSMDEWPLWEVFVRSKSGLDHKHCGSLHAADAQMAIQLARDVYTRRLEGCSVWVVRSDQIVASDPADKGMYFDPMEDKVYRHPTFYKLPSRSRPHVMEI